MYVESARHPHEAVGTTATVVAAAIAADLHPVETTVMEDATIAVAAGMMIADVMIAIAVAVIAIATTTVVAAHHDATEARLLAASAAHRDMIRWCWTGMLLETAD